MSEIYNLKYNLKMTKYGDDQIWRLENKEQVKPIDRKLEDKKDRKWAKYEGLTPRESRSR